MKTGQSAVRSIPMTPKADNKQTTMKHRHERVLAHPAFSHFHKDDYFLFAHGSH